MTKKLVVGEAATLLRCSPKTLYAWTSARKIPHLKIGGRLLFDEVELEKWLEQFQIKPKGGEGQTQG
jgi:excisionase family DNA binding protein